jgi:hypothetical protein
VKKLWLIPIVAIGLAFLLWQLWLTLLIGVREPAYKVVAKKEGYEVRKIQSYLTAHVDVIGSYDKTINEGFKILYAYISGNNHTRACMTMKLPMLHEVCQKGQSIPMMAPVIIDEGEKPASIKGSAAAPEIYRITFVLPQGYSLATVPQPRDQRIMLEEEPAKTVAVYPFRWYPTQERVEEQRALFATMLKRDKVCVRSAISLARYNPPFVLPLFMRNELMVAVEEHATCADNE